ncbi:MAG: class I SAM-dependent rRNA methyltransferase [Verrucomicrobium sp.]|nr:class I SAM-dependent rRNA methyltransferase [Verrucomicrobium sp.]
MDGTVHLGAGSRHRIREGHPWVFRNEIGRVEGSPPDGGTVLIRDAKGKPLGSGLYNSKSQITVRRYSTGTQELDRGFISRLLDEALAYRAALGSPFPAQRLFWSESDGLPGLILDRYGDALVLQTLTAATARLEPLIVELAVEKTGARAVVARNDVHVRALEGLPQEKKVLSGHYEPPTPLSILGVDLEIDLLAGQKTGLYLDQLENHAAVLAHAPGRRILDCFCNQGLFALAARRAGASLCDALDQSAEEIGRGRKAAEKAALSVGWIEANAFDWLREAERAGKQYDLIVLDPPPFARGKDQLAAARRGYHELHVRALRMLPRGGLLASYACSHHMGREMWREMLTEAAQDVGCSLRLVSALGQGRDHPVLLHVPETEYLKGFLVEKR